MVDVSPAYQEARDSKNLEKVRVYNFSQNCNNPSQYKDSSVSWARWWALQGEQFAKAEFRQTLEIMFESSLFGRRTGKPANRRIARLVIDNRR